MIPLKNHLFETWRARVAGSFFVAEELKEFFFPQNHRKIKEETLFLSPSVQEEASKGAPNAPLVWRKPEVIILGVPYGSLFGSERVILDAFGSAFDTGNKVKTVSWVRKRAPHVVSGMPCFGRSTPCGP
jgi:hypothetical protein